MAEVIPVVPASKVDPTDASVVAANTVALKCVAGLAWSGICFSVSKPQKDILSGVSGSSSSFTAIMGPSGAGKSTLMNILAGRTRTTKRQTVTGDVLFEGQKINPVTFSRNIGYVMQQDAIKFTQTPREAFTFAAALRLGDSITPEERTEKVEALVSQLKLEKCADTMIGDSRLRLPGVSGGEKKRTAIGVELISDPKILFLDEPTSGLDSYAAFQVVKTLSQMAKAGRTVLCTIHQPSSEVFSVFDDTLLLCGGQVVYHGPRSAMRGHFVQFGHKCPEDYNPADFVMFLMQEQPADQIKRLCDDWSEKSSAVKEEAEEEGGGGSSRDRPLKRRATGAERVQGASACTQMAWLARREVRSVVRNKGGLIAQVCSTVFLYLVVGNIFFDAASYGDVENTIESVSAVTDRHFGLVVFLATGSMFGLAQQQILQFPVERPIFLREYSAGVYGTVPYLASKLLVEIPQSFCVVLLIYLIAYWLTGLAGNIIYLVLITTLFGLVAASCSLLIGSLASNVEAGIQLTPLVFVPQLLFSGFYIPISQIPSYMRWAQYLCSLKYAINLLLIEELKNTPPSWPKDVNETIFRLAIFGCEEVDSDYECEGGGSSAALDYALFPRNDISYLATPLYLGILLAIFFGFRTLALVILTFKAQA